MPTPTSTNPDTLLQDGLQNGNGASQARTRAAELGRKAANVIDEKREAVARGMESAASTLHGHADSLPGGGQVARVAHTAASAMESASDYLRAQDLQGMVSDIRQIARRHPGATLLTAAALGFLLARSLTRR